MKKLFMLVGAVVIMSLFSVPTVKAEEDEKFVDYRTRKWHEIWHKPSPKNVANGGDVVFKHGKWVSGYFKYKNTWVKPKLKGYRY